MKKYGFNAVIKVCLLFAFLVQLDDVSMSLLVNKVTIMHVFDQ